MLKNISWTQYLTTLIIAVIIYYVFVLWVYFKKDFFERIKAKTASRKAHEDESNSPAFPRFFIEELRAYLPAASHNDISKEMLLHDLGRIAARYPDLTRTDNRESLEQFIISEAELHCAMSLSEQEVRGIWTEA